MCVRTLLICACMHFVINRIDETLSETTRHSRLKRNHRLPPLTPNAAVKDTVCNLVFDQIWNETVSLLQPVVTVIRERASTMGT